MAEPNGAVETPTAPATPESPAASATPAAPGPWDGIEGELLGVVQNAKWQTPKDAVKAYSDLLRFRGVPAEELIRTPKADATDDDWNEIYRKLGRPETAEGYGLQQVEGQPDLGALAYSAGLTPRQVEILQAGLEKIGEEQSQNSENQSAAQSEREWQELQRTWGKDFNAHVAQSQNAVQALGWDEETLGKLEGAMGTKWLMEFTARIGRGLADGGGLPGEAAPAGSFALTKEQALARYTQLNADPKFRERLQHPDKAVRMAAQRERQALNEIIDAP